MTTSLNIIVHLVTGANQCHSITGFIQYLGLFYDCTIGDIHSPASFSEWSISDLGNIMYGVIQREIFIVWGHSVASVFNVWQPSVNGVIIYLGSFSDWRHSMSVVIQCHKMSFGFSDFHSCYSVIYKGYSRFKDAQCLACVIQYMNQFSDWHHSVSISD